LQNRGNGFSLDPTHLNRLEPGKRPFHTLIPAMVFRDDKLFLSFGVMGGAIQAQGHIQVLSSLIDRKLGLQEAIDAPRYRFTEGKSVLLEDELGSPVIDSLIRKGLVRGKPPGSMRSSMGGGQAIMIDPQSGTLMGASDSRKDGLALGY
jgi:gamma-glutamyltranspeptidase/glutathione hydrolase